MDWKVNRSSQKKAIKHYYNIIIKKAIWMCLYILPEVKFKSLRNLQKIKANQWKQLEMLPLEGAPAQWMKSVQLLNYYFFFNFKKEKWSWVEALSYQYCSFSFYSIFIDFFATFVIVTNDIESPSWIYYFENAWYNIM